MTCEHNFTYQGRVTWPTDATLPGSGAHGRIYADAYYCVKCCEFKLTNEQEIGNTYEKALDGAAQYSHRPK